MLPKILQKNFIGVIPDTLEKKTSVQIVKSAYMAFLISGDADITTKECLTVYGHIFAHA